MCYVWIAMAAVAAASAAVQIAGESEKERSYANSTIQSTKAQVSEWSTQVNQQNTRYAQEVEAAHQEAQQNYLTNLEQQATAQTSAAGSGVAGISIENLFKGYDQASTLSEYISERNIRNQGLQYNQDYNAIRLRARNSIKTQLPYQGQGTKWAITNGIISTAGSAASSYFNTGGH